MGKIYKTFNINSYGFTTNEYKNEIFVPFKNNKRMNGKNIRVKFISLKLNYSTPNIITGVNNNLYFNISGTDYQIIIKQALYTFTSLKDYFKTALINLGLPVDAFTLITNKGALETGFTVGSSDVTFDFTQSDTCRDILGWDSQSLSISAGYSQYSDNISDYDNVGEYVLRSNDFSGHITYNGEDNNVVDVIPIPDQQKAGEPLTSEKRYPVILNADNWSTYKSGISFKITNQDGDDIYMLTNWYIRFDLEAESFNV